MQKEEKDFMKKQAIKFLEDLIIGLKDEKPETMSEIIAETDEEIVTE